MSLNPKHFIITRRNSLITGLWIILFITGSCTEIYEPDIDQVNNFLVVEGLLTNKQDTHSVKLSYSVRFGEDVQSIPCEDATVYIEDSQGQKILLSEQNAGEYHTTEPAKGEVGETYQLHIKTAEGHEYESLPQEMAAPVQADISAERGTDQFYQTSQVSNNIYERNVEGIFLFLNINNPKSNPGYFRFNSILVLQYVIVYQNGNTAETYDYCWVRRNVSDLNDSKIGQINDSAESPSSVQIAFLPEESMHMPYIGFPLEGYRPVRILIHSVYTINEDSYNFYQQTEQQLQDEGRFFDPIAAQVNGNIRSKNDPEEIVVGLFEVSSVSKSIYNVVSKANDEVEIQIIDSISDIPPSGCLYEEWPDFWIN